MSRRYIWCVLALISTAVLMTPRVSHGGGPAGTLKNRVHAVIDNVYIVPSEAAPTGVGEPATAVIAAAVTNAIFNLTGKRVRKLPINLALAFVRCALSRA